MSINNSESANNLSNCLRAGSTGINLRASYSFGGWVRWNNVANNIWNFAFGFATNAFASAAGILHTQNAGAGTLDFVRQDTFGFNDKVTASVGYANTTDWVHLCLVYDAPNTDIIAYVNGVSQGTVNSATTRCSNSTTTYLYMGPGVLDAVDIFHFSRILTADEIFRLSRSRGLSINRTNLTVWVPGNDPASLTAAGQDCSGNNLDMASVGSNTALSAVNPPVPLLPAPNPIFIAPSGVFHTLDAAGSSIVTGAAAIRAAKALDAAGTTLTTGAAELAVAKALGDATGSTVVSGAAEIAVGKVLDATGSTVTSGAAALTAAVDLAASGSTVTSGSAQVTAAADLAASGSTVTTGAANVVQLRPIDGTGSTVTSGSASVTAAAEVSASGSTVTSGAATLQAAFPVVASGSTVTSGTAIFLGQMPAEGSTVTTGAASITATQALSIAAAGSTVCSGSARFTGLPATGGPSGTGTTRRGALLYGTRRRIR